LQGSLSKMTGRRTRGQTALLQCVAVYLCVISCCVGGFGKRVQFWLRIFAKKTGRGTHGQRALLQCVAVCCSVLVCHVVWCKALCFGKAL